MPTKQRGSKPFRRGTTWATRYYDDRGVRRFQGGFQTKAEAWEWLDAKLGTVEALRRGDVAALRRQDMPTLQALVDEYLAQHV